MGKKNLHHLNDDFLLSLHQGLSILHQSWRQRNKKFEFHLTVSRLLHFNKRVRNVEAFSYLSETEEFTKTLIYSASLLLDFQHIF